MPPKSKRRLQLDKARENRYKKSRIETDREPLLNESFTTTVMSPVTDDCTEEIISETTALEDTQTTEKILSPDGDHSEGIPTFSDYDSHDEEYEPCIEALSESELIHCHVKEWIDSLSRDDLMSLSLLLHHLIVNVLGFQLTFAAKVIGDLINKSDRTVREWRATFLCNDGCFPDSLQGKYQRNGVVWQNEELNKDLRQYVRENANVKGEPNMTTASLCQWVNNELLSNHVLEPGFPRKISIDTARRWLHHLEFRVLDRKKEFT